MNEIVNKFSFVGDKFMPEMLYGTRIQQQFLWTITKNKEKKIRETGYSRYIYQKELDKACFQHDILYEDFKGLRRRIAAGKVLHLKTYNIAKNLKHDNINVELFQFFINYLIKKLQMALLKVELC